MFDPKTVLTTTATGRSHPANECPLVLFWGGNQKQTWRFTKNRKTTNQRAPARPKFIKPQETMRSGFASFRQASPRRRRSAIGGRVLAKRASCMLSTQTLLMMETGKTMILNLAKICANDLAAKF